MKVFLIQVAIQQRSAALQARQRDLKRQQLQREQQREHVRQIQQAQLKLQKLHQDKGSENGFAKRSAVSLNDTASAELSRRIRNQDAQGRFLVSEP